MQEGWECQLTNGRVCIAVSEHLNPDEPFNLSSLANQGVEISSVHWEELDRLDPVMD